jgi:hypothetical protein
MSNTTADNLRRARAKIERPECWTKGEYAKDTDGRKVGVRNPSAHCWCALGALMATGCTVETAGYLLRPHLPTEYRNAWSFNDRATHADILALYDRAIAVAEKSE